MGTPTVPNTANAECRVSSRAWAGAVIPNMAATIESTQAIILTDAESAPMVQPLSLEDRSSPSARLALPSLECRHVCRIAVGQVRGESGEDAAVGDQGIVLGLRTGTDVGHVGAIRCRLERSWMRVPRGTMAAGKLGVELLELIPVSCAPSQVVNDAHSEPVAAHVGEMFTKQIGCSTDVAGGHGADYFNVVAFPAQRPATGGTRGCSGDGGEVGDGEPEAGIGQDGVTEGPYEDRRIRSLLRLAVEAGGLDVGCDHSTVLLDGRTNRGRLATASVGPFWMAFHDHQVALVT